jgi:hypothetical protein
MNDNKIKSFLIFTLILSVSIYSLFASNGQIDQLQNHFQNCEYKKSIELAKIILKNHSLTKSERTDTFIIKGVAEFSSKKFLDARLTFIELLIFDGSITLNSKEVSPKIVDFFNELKYQLQQT